MSNYSQLNPELLVATVEKLSTRIGERFPKAGLFRVSKHLCNIAAESRRRVTETGRRSLWIRAAIVLLLILMVAGVVMSVSAFRIQPKTDDVTWVELVQAMESGINDIVFVGIGVFFLASLETRMRRRRSTRAPASGRWRR